MDNYLLKHATHDQLSRLGKKSQEMQMIKRMMSEPPLYRPSPMFCGFIIACSFQCEKPVEKKILLFNGGRYDSFKAIIDGQQQTGLGGWYRWGEVMAEKMPRRILASY